MSVKWGFGELDVYVGNIWELATQAIVSPVNCELIPAAGLGAEIARLAGSSVERELASHLSVSIGDVVVTGSGALRCQRIIHAALQSLRVNVNEDAITECLSAVFEVCRKEQLKSLALPTFGISPRNLPLRLAADLFVEPVMEWLRKSRIPERVVLVVPSESMAQILNDSAKSRKMGLN